MTPRGRPVPWMALPGKRSCPPGKICSAPGQGKTELSGIGLASLPGTSAAALTEGTKAEWRGPVSAIPSPGILDRVRRPLDGPK